MTMASYTRKFVTEHKAYQKDSVVNDEITWYRLPSLHSLILCVRRVSLMRVSCGRVWYWHSPLVVRVCLLPGT